MDTHQAHCENFCRFEYDDYETFFFFLVTLNLKQKRKKENQERSMMYTEENPQ
jgi:hypothetical protein